jgi:D-alanyl-lipoteichoic acid acyltransferase DltB (MBOAT superfamily)
MLFNTYEFIFIFLPVVLAVFCLLGRLGNAPVIAWLAGASLFFYGWWNPRFVGLLAASIAFNFLMGGGLRGARMLLSGKGF